MRYETAPILLINCLFDPFSDLLQCTDAVCTIRYMRTRRTVYTASCRLWNRAQFRLKTTVYGICMYSETRETAGPRDPAKSRNYPGSVVLLPSNFDGI